MSIATLKKKTLSSYKIMSSGFQTFSLNGTRRSQGYVGQTSLSRSLPKTMMKGNVACGHGGCCGTYPIGRIVQSAVTSLNNPNIVKSSVLNTSGMIETKYRWVKRPPPFSTTKPDCHNNINTQADYINYLKKKTVNKINKCNLNIVKKVPKYVCTEKNYNNIFRSHLYPKRVKSISNIIVLDNYLKKSYTDDYLVSLNNECSASHDVFFVANKFDNRPVLGSF